jgi:hypothetical protein
MTLEARDVRRAVNEGKKDLLVSSSLSEGRLEPRGILFMGEVPRTGSDMAEGSRVGLFFSKVIGASLVDPLRSSLD